MGKEAFTKDEREYFYDAIIHLDADKKYVIYDKENDTLSYNTNTIKSHESISGKPTDEELTRALILLNLVVNYGYDCKVIEIENTFKIGGHNQKMARAVETDICIKDLSGNISILCEVKRIQKYCGTDDPSIEKQLFDPYQNIVKYNNAKYLYHLSCDIPVSKTHFPLQCIGIDTSICSSYEHWEKNGKNPHFTDFHISGKKPLLEDVFIKNNTSSTLNKDLKTEFGINELKRIWRSLWDYIWGGTLEDNKKFENFNKILLAKIYDERKTLNGSAYTFQRKYKAGKFQNDVELAQDIDLLYRKAYREYLSKDKNIDLKSVKGIDSKEFPVSLVSKCVELLQALSFHKNRYKNVDILGEFYEMVVRDAFKQTKGLFLTHPNVVLFILSALDVESMVKEKLKKPDQDNRYRLPFVIDPSCGTGSFLIHYMHFVQKYVEANNKSISSGDEDVSDFIERNMLQKNAYKWVIDYVYGIDNEPVLATACQINLILHGDGSTNIYNTDGLDSFSDYGKLEVTGAVNILSSNIIDKNDYYNRSSICKFDIIVSNPPFNVNLHQSGLAINFSISGKSEAYFLERWYQLLKPNGRIGVVLPESFFSVEDDIDGRMFLYKHFNVRAIISLPSHTFMPHTTTTTSLLLASKKTADEELLFKAEWDRNDIIFVEKMNNLLSILPPNKSSVDFNTKSRSENHIKNFLAKLESKAAEHFGNSFIVFPFFNDSFLADEANYIKLKKSIKDVVVFTKERWILNQVSKKSRAMFYNFSVDNIGYKAGKKGSKDKPNELFNVEDDSGKRIYNVKYAHAWDTIDSTDTETVLGMIKDLNIWQ